MESSVLNLAHEKHRRAEAFLIKGQFDKAIECHEAIVNLLLEAQSQLQTNASAKFCTFSPNRSNLNVNVPLFVTLQSLNLQKNYHRRQAKIVRMKQAEFEEYKARVESQKNELLNKQCSKSSAKYEPDYLLEKLDEPLDRLIYRTIDKQDNLLSLICTSEDEQSSRKNLSDLEGIVEELRTGNAQLRSFVEVLTNQLEIKEQEIRRYKEQFESSSGVPSEETPLDSLHSVHLEPLPPLAPIEMPEFNLNST